MFEKIKKFYKKMQKWYESLKWYWKVLLFVPVLLIAICLTIAALSTSGVSGKATKEHIKMVDSILNGMKKNVEAEKEAIDERKKFILKNLELADKIDAETLKRKDRILLAESMEELDKLQEEFEL